jgi:hypothetical protein
VYSIWQGLKNGKLAGNASGTFSDTGSYRPIIIRHSQIHVPSGAVDQRSIFALKLFVR